MDVAARQVVQENRERVQPRFGVHVGLQSCSISELTTMWKAVEKAGFDWISVWDHLYPSQIDESKDCFEALSCHAALAAVTSAVRVGCLVYSAGYRHPGMLANAAVTIDHLSGGRLELGIGAGWHQHEYFAYGLPFEEPATRLRRLKEYVNVVRALFVEPTVDFDGEFFTLTGAMCNPKPLQASPRIWVGVSGPKALAQAGQIGDGWNIAFVSPDEFATKRSAVLSAAPHPDRFQTSVNLALIPAGEDRLAHLRERFGPAADMISAGVLTGSADAVTDAIGRYLDAGADWIVLAARAPFDVESIQTFAAEVIPRFRRASPR